MVVDLAQNFAIKGSENKTFGLQNPVLAASGTYGYTIEYSVFNNVQKLGAVVTKAITLKPRAGNKGTRLFETASGMINSIGLENIGVEEFVKRKIPVFQKSGVNYIVNVAGSTIEEYSTVAKMLEVADVSAIEVNASCPNVKNGCLEFGTDPVLLGELISAVRAAFSGFLIIKLTPNVADIESLTIAAKNAGADCISAINTVKGLGVDLQFINTGEGGKFHKTLTQGGLSGKCIKPVALSFVKRIRTCTDLPIIGIGGISKLQDIFEFMAVGADAVQIGTENFTTPDVCESLVNELTEFMATNGFGTLEELKGELRQ